MSLRTSQPNKTTWPDAAPLEGEGLIITISCGNSHLNWATHLGDEDDFNPHIFWRTPHLKEEDLQYEDMITILSKNLPDEPHDYVFGKATDATAANAASQSITRSVPLISVYVVSTNQGQEALLAKIWETVPSRFFVMKGDDFFNKEEGRYDSMGTDRLATLFGAVYLHGHPSLVFDGGTATTYSATDGFGNILGGGIGPGIQCKFRSLRTDTAALPEISSEEVMSRVKEAQELGMPLPTFARNTKEAMMVDAFQEFALKGRNVIDHWLEKTFQKSMPTAIASGGSEGAKINTGRRVLCTGGDGDILMQLLQPHHGGLIEHIASDDGAQPLTGYKVESSKHLIHYGIACVLSKQSTLSKQRIELTKSKTLQNNMEQLIGGPKEYVGKRVAKQFKVETDDGDNIFRGKVAKIFEVDGKDPDFHIQYDDGDSEDVAMDELLGMFKMYAEHGEKKLVKAAMGKRVRVKKVKAAQNEDNVKDGEKKQRGRAKKMDAAQIQKKEDEVANGAKESVKSAPAGNHLGADIANDQVRRKRKSAADIENVTIKTVKGITAAGKGLDEKIVDSPVQKEENPVATDEKVTTTTTNLRDEKAMDIPSFPIVSQSLDEGTAGDGERKSRSGRKKIDAAQAQKEVESAATEDKPVFRTANFDIPSFPIKRAMHMTNSASKGTKSRRSRMDGIVAGGKPPTAKKAKIEDKFSALVNSSDPRSFVVKRISKVFDGKTFFGTISDYDNSENSSLWHVKYDDGDEEDYNKKDLMEALRHYSIHGKDDPNKLTEAWA